MPHLLAKISHTIPHRWLPAGQLAEPCLQLKVRKGSQQLLLCQSCGSQAPILVTGGWHAYIARAYGLFHSFDLIHSCMMLYLLYGAKVDHRPLEVQADHIKLRDFYVPICWFPLTFDRVPGFAVIFT